MAAASAVFRTVVTSALDLVKSKLYEYLKNESPQVATAVITLVSTIVMFVALDGWDVVKTWLVKAYSIYWDRFVFKNPKKRSYTSWLIPKKLETASTAKVTYYSNTGSGHIFRFISTLQRENKLPHRQSKVVIDAAVLDVATDAPSMPEGANLSDMPVFYHHGYAVYATTTERTVTLQSDSIIAIFEFVDEVKQWAKVHPSFSSTDLVADRFLRLHSWDFKNNCATATSKIQRQSWDDLVLADKLALITCVNRFVEFRRAGKSMTLGVLLHGPPGTGKTSVIRAVCAHLNRAPIEIDLKRVRKLSILQDILKEAVERDMIIVFDEFDFLVDSLLASKQLAEQQRQIAAAFLQQAATEPNPDTRKQLIATHDKTITEIADLDIGSLLRELDGLHDYNGRVIIATTNHPKKIPEALKRPGRFDLVLELKNLTGAQVNELLDKLYHREGSNFEFKDYVHSPAHVENLYTLGRSFEEAVSELQLPTADTADIDVLEPELPSEISAQATSLAAAAAASMRKRA